MTTKQTYRVIAELAEQKGVWITETCVLCDGAEVGIRCASPVCRLVVCRYCWSGHLEDSPRCLDENLLAASKLTSA